MRLIHGGDGTYLHTEYSMDELDKMSDSMEIMIEEFGPESIKISDRHGNIIVVEPTGDCAGSHWLNVWVNGLRLDVYSDD